MTQVELTVVGAVRQGTDLSELGVRRSTTCTVLELAVRDQSALYGVLQRLAALGLELRELRTVPAGGRPDVEVTVHGPVGIVLRAMLGSISRSEAAETSSYTVRDVDLSEVLALMDSVVDDGGGGGGGGGARGSSPRAGEDGNRAPAHGGGAESIRDPGGRTGTKGREMDRTIDEMGPVDYLVVEFPENKLNGEALPLLVDLVDRGIIRLLDLAFVEKAADGTVAGIELHDLDVDGDFDLAVFDGASSGILAEDDLQEAGATLQPGSAAGVLVYENVWAAPFAAALRRGGGMIAASGRIPVPSLVAALDAAEGH
ncbi:DUF6325 family protein [Puerhibacterium puerhi]|uniref:DUF6325 family protein n=1 Tax=Puerhibacterium puerhi TaxID=2692623 RepID=UPI001F3B2D8F|nr:DUF6325 family protein [Puerhibacterium puerhi]